MSDSSPFVEFIRRIRAGDSGAAEELVRRYEPLIRREVHLNLGDRRLGRLFDSMDVCQSVFKSFFVRTAAGEYDLDDPSQLVRLLVSMTRNKLASAARREVRQKRDHRRGVVDDEALAAIKAAGSTPSRVVEGRDLIGEFRVRLTDEERQLADLRTKEGLTWEAIAERLGGTAHGRRVQFSRAINRVLHELKLEEAEDE